MKSGPVQKLSSFVAVQKLTRTRVLLALGVAVAADALQFFVGPLGWFFFDEIVDVIAMIVTIRLLGFHPVLLPTFAMEFIPVVDLLPTWTACVALVISLRKKKEKKEGEI